MRTFFCLYPPFGSEPKLFPNFILKFVSRMPWQPLIDTFWESTAYFLTENILSFNIINCGWYSEGRITFTTMFSYG